MKNNKFQVEDFLGLDHFLDEEQAYDVVDRANSLLEAEINKMPLVQGQRFTFTKAFTVWRRKDSTISFSHFTARLCNIKRNR